MAHRFIRVVSLWIHQGQAAAFEAFERDAARIMARHGGRIERAVRIGAAAGEDAPFEVHIVSFPDEAAFAAYGADAETQALKDRRNRIVARTLALPGEDAVPY